MATSPATATARSGAPAPGGPAFAWLDLIRAFAIAWIFLNHVSERIFGYPFIANPAPGWPPLHDRVAQLAPLAGHGAWDVPLNLLRWIGWSGDQGVQLFLIASGFGLTWGLLRRTRGAGPGAPGPLPLGEFYGRRLMRIYPPWWGAHLLFAASALVLGWGFSPLSHAFWLSFVGIRVTPRLLYVFAPAWWYVGLILQLYAIYPLLWEALRRRGPAWLLGMSCLIAFAARAAGLLFLHGYLDAWQRGALFVTRLPEFVLGIALAAWMARAPAEADAQLRRPVVLLASAAAYVVATALSLTLLGMAVAPFLLGASLFLLLHALFTGAPGWSGRAARPLVWIGRRSYGFYLVHDPIVHKLVPAGIAHGRRALVGALLAAALTVVLGVALEWTVERVVAVLGRARARHGLGGVSARVAAGAALVFALLVGAELLSRRVAPQELEGWGERAALTPDPVLGWRLKPSRDTRLRWVSYDYRVQANALGFPGPEYPVGKAPGVFRILVTGDAFSSAEGVNTADSWPRLLETRLARAGGPSAAAGAAAGARRKVEVLDFAITGYGPNQYAAVVREFAPRYRPDLILIETYVNDYQDVLTSDSTFRASIGFGRPSPDRLGAILRLENLGELLRLGLKEPLLERLRHQPRPQGYFLGGFTALERRRSSDPRAREAMSARLAEIRSEASRIQCRVVLVMVPAPVQVCGRRDLRYFPQGVDLADTARFDPDGPQRETRAIADSLGLGCLDLRSVLARAAGGCPYQPRNIHWTAAGHRAVAAWLADTLAQGLGFERR